MIWTVVLKNGEGFVVHGSSYDRNTEVRKCLKGRRLSEEAVAGIVQGNHQVEPYQQIVAVHTSENFSEQFKAALAAPEMGESITEKVMEEVLSKPDLSPMDENGRPFNDPAKW